MDVGFSMNQRAKTKAYEAPKLVRYGDLIEVTRNTALRMAGSDHAPNAPNKTA